MSESTSAIDNTENIRVLLEAGKDYLLEVRPKTGQAAFEWDYALAWQMVENAESLDADGDGVYDTADNCINVANPGQHDADGDGHGNICDADFDQDCSVSFLDLSIFKAGFFGGDANLDLDSSGSVDFTDLAMMNDVFFTSPGPSAAGLCN